MASLLFHCFLEFISKMDEEPAKEKPIAANFPTYSFNHRIPNAFGRERGMFQKKKFSAFLSDLRSGL